MRGYPQNILRIGLGITFLWIGVLILKDPLGWGGYIQPWARQFMLGSIEHAMIATAVLDILVGFFLLIDKYTFLASILGTAHLIIVLVTAGINESTVRDIGLLAAIIALAFQSYPLHGWPKTIKETLFALFKS